MFKKFFILCLLLNITFVNVYSQLKKLTAPNLRTEADIFTDNKGNWYSNTLRVHFAQKTIDLESQKSFASISDILLPELKKVFSGIEEKYGKFTLKKVFTNSYWGDTVGVHIVTKEKVRLKDLSQFYKIIFDHVICVDSLIMQLKELKYFESVGRPAGAISTYEPNDYSASEQWTLPRIEATKAWDITRGSNQIKIGINDIFASTDINNLHNELRNGKVVFNPSNLCSGHGQSVAGCAGALTDNGIGGISSIGFNSSLMFTTWGADGINQLRNNGAHVINCSWLWWSSPDLDSAVYNALNQGIIITAGSGNNQNNVSWFGTIPVVVYPAAYNFPSIGKQVIAVTATHLDSGSEVFGYPPDGRWNYSPGTDPINNPTTSFVDFSAPGVFIKCLDGTITNAYTTASGTSMSAPEVAGVIGLIRSIYPNLTPQIAYTILRNTAEKVGADNYNANGWNQYMGYGRVNAYKALKYTLENYGGTLTQNLTIPSGETWNFQPGVTVSFASGTSITVFGTLNAIGTSANNITFTRSGTTGTWDGIDFQSSGNGTIDNCIISNAQTALSLGGTSSVEITNNFIHDNTQNGIFLNMSSPDINNNQIRNNGYYGIWAQNESAPSITNNIITGNSYAGIYSDLYSTIGSAYGSQGSNAIRSNSYGMISNYNSEDYFGYSGNGGSNSICGNSGYEVTATSNSYVIVQGNWWGSNPPNASEFYADGTSYIDRSSPLSSDPNPTMQKINSLAVNTPGLDVTQSLTIDWESFFDADIMEAMQSFFAGNYQDASNKFEKKFNKEKDVKKKKYVLAKISQCYLKMGSKGFIDYLNNNVRPTLSKNDELFAVALELEYLSFFREGKFESAVNNLNNIKDNFSTNEEMYKHSLFNLSFVYGKYLNNINKAKEYLVELETKFPNDRLVLNGKVLILGEDPVNFSNKDQFRIASSSTSNSEQFELLNYPNPFNPSTTISYTIPEDGKVQIKVFDILGREVTTLVNEFTSAGKHNVVWDGANFASGIYFCNILFKGQILNKKMLLVK